METQLSYLSFHRHVKFMQRIGIYPISRNASKTKQKFHAVFRCIVLFLAFMYPVQQFLKICEVLNAHVPFYMFRTDLQRSVVTGRLLSFGPLQIGPKRLAFKKIYPDIDKAMEIICLLISNVNFFYKIVVLKIKYDDVEEILQITKGPIFNQGELEHRAPLLESARYSLLIVSSFNYISLLTCVLWALRPVLELYQGKEVNVQIWLPFDTNVTYYFCIGALYWWVQTSLLAVGNSIVDGFIAFLFEQCKAQIKILRMDLKNVVKKSKIAKTGSSESFSDILETKLKKIIIHHSEIIKMTNKIQDIFGSPVFNQFIISGWILCTSVYSVVDTETPTIQLAEMVLYICCMLIECFLFCYYGSNLTFESNRLTEFAYASDWLDFPLKQRRLLIIFMERIKRPIQPTAGSLIPLSNNTFISVITYLKDGKEKIVRSSYTFYAFLKNSN